MQGLPVTSPLSVSVPTQSRTSLSARPYFSRSSR